MIKSNFQKWAPAIAAVAVGTMGSVFADGPLDLEATGTTVAGYVAGAAGAAVAVMAALYGVRVIVRAFKSVR